MLNRESLRKKPIIGLAPISPDILENHVKVMVPGKIVTSANPPERLQLWFSMDQQGRMEDFFGRDERLSPIKVVAKTESLPFRLVMHASEGKLSDLVCSDLQGCENLVPQLI